MIFGYNLIVDRSLIIAVYEHNYQSQLHRKVVERKTISYGKSMDFTLIDKLLRRAYRWLGILNDLLLVPMFAIIVIEISNQEMQSPQLEMQGLILNGFFFSEWLFGLLLTANRRAYLFEISKILDFISCLPFGVLTQGVRVARISRVLKVIRFVTRAKRYKGVGEELLRVAALVGATIFAGGYSILVIEPTNSNIGSFPEALWWSLVTVSTVGYGDMYPETMAGRMVAAPLIAVGVGVCGYVAGSMSKWMTSDKLEKEESQQYSEQLQVISQQLKQILETEEKIEERLTNLERKIERASPPK
jgi:voltage-gated potassium channel